MFQSLAEVSLDLIRVGPPRMVGATKRCTGPVLRHCGPRAELPKPPAPFASWEVRVPEVQGQHRWPIEKQKLHLGCLSVEPVVLLRGHLPEHPSPVQQPFTIQPLPRRGLGYRTHSCQLVLLVACQSWRRGQGGKVGDSLQVHLDDARCFSRNTCAVFQFDGVFMLLPVRGAQAPWT